MGPVQGSRDIIIRLEANVLNNDVIQLPLYQYNNAEATAQVPTSDATLMLTISSQIALNDEGFVDSLITR